jgi:hypothetical protein
MEVTRTKVRLWVSVRDIGRDRVRERGSVSFKIGVRVRVK